MGHWRKVRIGDLLTQRKAQIHIDPETDYSLVTISKKGIVKLREIKSGSIISAKKGYIVKKGDFIYSRLSVHTGAFGIVPIELNNALVTNEMPCFQIDTTKILPEILIKMIELPDFLRQLQQLTKGMGRVRIKESMLLSLSLVLPDIKKQREIATHFKSVETEDTELKVELTHQQILLTKLRQKILQEAIEGKLTQDWREQNPDVESASELLKRINAKKQQLIKDKKIKQQKLLPAISEGEKPFELPEKWSWCRLGEVSEVKVGATPSRENSEYWGGNINWVSSGEVANNFITITKELLTEKGVNESSAKINPKGSVLVAMIGQGKTRGQTAILKIDAATNQNVAAIRPPSEIISEILWRFFLSRYEITRSGASGGNQPALNGLKIKSTVFALPPFTEQKAIIAKIEKLFVICDQLEAQMTRSQTNAEQLMQSVLKEAFSQNDGT